MSMLSIFYEILCLTYNYVHF